MRKLSITNINDGLFNNSHPTKARNKIFKENNVCQRPTDAV